MIIGCHLVLGKSANMLVCFIIILLVRVRWKFNVFDVHLLFLTLDLKTLLGGSITMRFRFLVLLLLPFNTVNFIILCLLGGSYRCFITSCLFLFNCSFFSWLDLKPGIFLNLFHVNLLFEFVDESCWLNRHHHVIKWQVLQVLMRW